MNFFSKRYYSSARLLFASLLLILLLFILLSLLFYHRLQQAQQIVSNVAEQAVPAVLEASQVHDKVKELNLQSELLRDAISQAARARASQQISQIIVQISSLDHQQYVQHQYQQQRLRLIADEARSLDMLIAERLVLQQQSRQWLERLSQLQQQSQQFNTSNTSQPWLLHYSGLLQNVTALYNIDRLYNLRQSGVELEKLLSTNKQLLNQLSQAERQAAAALFEQLHAALLSEQGIFSLREAELSNIARATGKANFLRSLVTDYASETELNAYQSAASLMQLSQQSSIALQRQNQFSFGLALAAILLLLAIMFYTQKRVIKRLKLLNKKVLAGSGFEDDDILFASNDEIADIARSFTEYRKTVAAQQTALERQSLTDGLTGIANRRHFDSQLNSAVAMAKRMQQPLAVLLLDVDHFKAYNDSYGHLAGDDTLKAIAKTLADTLQRQIDLVARYGGEEFACILPNTSPEQAKIMAEQLRLDVLALMLPHHASPTAGFITISLGISCLLPGQDISDKVLLNQADKALYQAKSQGRNCCVMV
ncbi:GGDEF domain-containing protein [Arsukibacterium indicum]|uniref:diguanylate cyclase n=1 Tax=Arsukibacterium indicum TaxID=2848612 RepID=A0ABS6MMH8_9GAMM|nr:GGDEF domain-containing protein [Arsukibacterium indicum]MBV2129574.1 GGDEF domain-containing protein [Arsukibacterium indicum]